MLEYSYRGCYSKVQALSNESKGEDVLVSEGAELDEVDESAVGRVIRQKLQ